ncbi:MAG: putative ABC transporter permease [Clostridia bacterium]
MCSIDSSSLQIWDYTGQPGNIMGQICLPYGVLWFAIMPFTIWLEDRLRWSL